MDYRIERMDVDLQIVGRGKPVKTNRAFKMIPTLWSDAKKDGFMDELVYLSYGPDETPLGTILGICGNEAAIKDDHFIYFMGVRHEGQAPSGLETMIISNGTWAVFPKITEAWKQLYDEWLPNSGFELAKAPCIECYYPPKHKPRNELWVPVIPKQEKI
ncbi:GyrI-like domain-containing protein [Chungangia koreensis]|uniref:GyrI-like domain-containing protein n=1 Tax=Chungangia koreensis TaxID=752657 RepID=A0ABV8WZF8_9LACT